MNRLFKIICILICIVFCFMMLTTTVLASDTSHLDCCQVQNCSMCKLIQNAIDFIRIISYVIEYIILINVVKSFYDICINRTSLKLQDTLITLNVRLNE